MAGLSGSFWRYKKSHFMNSADSAIFKNLMNLLYSAPFYFSWSTTCILVFLMTSPIHFWQSKQYLCCYYVAADGFMAILLFNLKKIDTGQRLWPFLVPFCIVPLIFKNASIKQPLSVQLIDNGLKGFNNVFL